MALTDKLAAIADAIRSKTGDTAGLTLDQMPAAIAGIQGGGTVVETLPNAEESAFGFNPNGNCLTPTNSIKYMYASYTQGWVFEALESFTAIGIRHQQSSGTKTLRVSQDGVALRTIYNDEEATNDNWVSCYFDSPLNIVAGGVYYVTCYGIPKGTVSDKPTFDGKVRFLGRSLAMGDVIPTTYNADYLYYIPHVDLIVGDTLELPNNYQITRTTMDNIAVEVQRITGSTAKMTTEQIITVLQGIETTA